MGIVDLLFPTISKQDIEEEKQELQFEQYPWFMSRVLVLVSLLLKLGL